MFEKTLREIGLTENEIKVYNALIKLGKTSTGPLIDQAKISGSKIYEVLNRLIEKGLVSCVVEKKWKRYEVTDPSTILQYLEKKQEEIEKQKSDAKHIIKQIEKQVKTKIKDSVVRVFKGFEAVKTAYDDIDKTLKKGQEWLSMGIASQPKHWEIHFDKQTAQRDKNGIKCKLILDPSYKSLYKTRGKRKNTQIRFFETKLFLPTSTDIYGNKVLITVCIEGGITIMIENEKIAESFRKQFYASWKSAKKR